jgi:hypothetical protein
MKPAGKITDRAKRYRARQRIPKGERRCIYCGQPNARDVDHLDGQESNQTRDNLAWSCVSCNTSKGAAFARVGLGHRTRQFNPKAQGASNLAQWVMAVLSIKGHGPWSIQEGVETIRATPASDRSAYAREIWRRRRAWATASRTGRRPAEDEIPF